MKKRDCLLSVAMIVKDEEHNIKRALESIKDIADEIVVVDTGSKDRTPEIVKEYTDKLYFHEWRDDFSEARNYSLKFPTCKWVMIFDADEEVSEEFKKNIRDFLKSLPDDVNTIYAPAISYLDWDLKRKEVATIPRIFKNGTVYYKNIVHNQPIYKPKIARCPYPVYHYGYIWTRKLKEKKYIRTRNLIVKFLKEIKDPVEKIYYLIQLYKTEGTTGYDYRKFDAAWKAFEILKRLKVAPTIAMEFLFLFGMECLKADIVDLAEDLFRSAMNAEKDFPDPYYAMMALYEKKEEWEKVIEWGNKFFEVFDRASKKLEEFSWTIVSMNYLATAHAVVSRAYLKIEDYEKALEHIQESVSLVKETGEDLESILKYYSMELISLDDKETIESAKDVFVFVIKSFIDNGLISDHLIVLLEKLLENDIDIPFDVLEKIKPRNKYEECLLKQFRKRQDCFKDILLSSKSAVDLVMDYGIGALLVLHDLFNEEERLKFLNELRRKSEDEKLKGVVLALMGDHYLKSSKFKEALNLYKKSVEALPELSHVVKPIIEDLKTRLSTDIDGVYEELLKDFSQKKELIWDISKYLGVNLVRKLHLISSHPLAKYVSAIFQTSPQKTRKILEDIEKHHEKFPFYYYRLAKTYEEDDKEKAFRLHVKACENNYGLADISLGKFSYTGLYPNTNLPFMREKDEILWVGNMSEKFSTLGIIHPVRAWKRSKDNLIYAYPFPSEEALRIYKDREKKFYKGVPFIVKDEHVASALIESNWTGGKISVYPEDFREKYDWIFRDLNIDLEESSQKLLILDGVEEIYNLKDLLKNSKEVILFYRVPVLKNRNDSVWYYPRFRVLRTTYKIIDEIEKFGYKILTMKALDKNLRMVHIEKQD